MPELPEVETVVRDIRPHLVGQRILRIETSAHSLRRPWQKTWENDLIGLPIRAVERRGKWTTVNLGGPHLLLHLGMTGQLTIGANSLPRDQHTHLIFHLKKPKEELRFRDVRRFGSASVYADEYALLNFFEESGLGPEPFSLESAYWRQSLEKTNRCLKAILLDQRVLAGVGNIYADEALFEAKLNPNALGSSLSAKESNRLKKAIVTVLTRAIERRGSSIRDYVGGSGGKGNYQSEFRAYGQTGKPCPRCQTPIERIVLAGRSTHFCPNCQGDGL